MFINQYSSIVTGLLILLIVTLATWRTFELKWTMIAVSLTFIAIVSFQMIGSTTSSNISSIVEFDNVLTSGKPVLLELYSNYWVACLSAKPAVDRLENQLGDEYVVVRFDISSEIGKYVRSKYNANVTPTFIVFNTDGDLVWKRSGQVPSLQTILSIDA